MNIKDLYNEIRSMDCEIAEVIARKPNTYSFSYIVYLVSDPSNSDLVNPNLHDFIFDSIDEFENSFLDCPYYDFDLFEFETDYKKDQSN